MDLSKITKTNALETFEQHLHNYRHNNKSYSFRFLVSEKHWSDYEGAMQGLRCILHDLQERGRCVNPFTLPLLEQRVRSWRELFQTRSEQIYSGFVFVRVGFVKSLSDSPEQPFLEAIQYNTVALVRSMDDSLIAHTVDAGNIPLHLEGFFNLAYMPKQALQSMFEGFFS